VPVETICSNYKARKPSGHR